MKLNIFIKPNKVCVDECSNPVGIVLPVLQVKTLILQGVCILLMFTLLVLVT